MKNTNRHIPLILTVIFACVLVGVFIYRQYNPTTVSLTNIQRTSNPSTTQAIFSIIDGKININQATEEDLILLPGIGETLAKRIVEYRDQNGPFTLLEDLQKVSGIGQVRFDRILDYITLGK